MGFGTFFKPTTKKRVTVGVKELTKDSLIEVDVMVRSKDELKWILILIKN